MSDEIGKNSRKIAQLPNIDTKAACAESGPTGHGFGASRFRVVIDIPPVLSLAKRPTIDSHTSYIATVRVIDFAILMDCFPKCK